MSSLKGSWVRQGISPVLIFLIFLLAFGLTACKKKDEKSPVEKKPTSPVSAAPQAVTPAEKPAIGPGGVVIEVDGSKLTKAQMDEELNGQMALIKKQLTAEKKQLTAEKLLQVKDSVQKQIVNGFVVRTLLNNEVNRLKINASEKEVDEAIDKIKSTLPANKTLDDLIKEDHITKEKMREGIRLKIRIDKFVLPQMKGLPKPTDKEIAAFYKKNQKDFKLPEAVHVRHILIARAPEDSEKVIAEKKAKAEDLRKKLLAGADFAELAKNNSDCPSKNSGGDLGIVKRGDMVKPFEDAIFALKKDQIGPVVQTEFGFHVVQVLDVRQPKTVALDEKTKVMISSYLQKKKQQQTFINIVKHLREKANVISYMP